MNPKARKKWQIYFEKGIDNEGGLWYNIDEGMRLAALGGGGAPWARSCGSWERLKAAWELRAKFCR